MADEYTDLSDIKVRGSVYADEKMKANSMDASSIVADSITDRTGKEYALKEQVEAVDAKKPDKETIVVNGISRISNEVGDIGACLKFTHNTGYKSGIGVNNGEYKGLYGQIYATDSSNNGTRIDITQQKIYYLKGNNNDFTDNDEIAVKGDIKDTGAVWGQITGTMSNQADLTNRLAAMDQATMNVETKVTNETTRATTAESNLNTAIGNEVTRATTAESGLIKLVNKDTETAGVACSVPYFMAPDFTDPETITVNIKKIHLTQNENRVDDYTFPVPRAYINETLPISGQIGSTAGLYTKSLADRKADVKAIGTSDCTYVNNDQFGSRIESLLNADPTKKSTISVKDGKFSIQSLTASGNVFMESNNGKIYYHHGTGTIVDGNEIATKADITGVHVGTFIGTFATKALLLAHPIASLGVNDYAIVTADESRTPQGQTTRYIWTSTEWKFEYVIEENNTVKLVDMASETSGLAPLVPWRADWNFTESAVNVTVHTLDMSKNASRIGTNTITIPAMTDTTAGLYTKSLADKKQDKIIDTISTLPKTAWVQQASGFYTQTIAIAGITAQSYPIVYPNYETCTTLEAYEALKDASSHILKADTGAGTATFFADETPSMDVPIIVKVM